MIGFNINTFFGEPYAYDINMRAFETLSCGVPLFTNDTPSLFRVFPPGTSFIRTYADLPDLLPSLLKALKDTAFMNSGAEARRWIVDNATYVHRMREVLKVGCRF
jgi:spore maturation protein CgeB